jgi:hypothetical protein
LIRDYIAEHEHVTNVGDDAVRAIDAGDLESAQLYVGEMAVLLAAHWEGEENGIFRVMQRDAEYLDYIAPLVAEHRALAQLLAAVNLEDSSDQHRIRLALIELDEHISKEEDGLFPASLTALGGDEWDAAMDAWHEAHPGEEMLRD